VQTDCTCTRRRLNSTSVKVWSNALVAETKFITFKMSRLSFKGWKQYAVKKHIKNQVHNKHVKEEFYIFQDSTKLKLNVFYKLEFNKARKMLYLFSWDFPTRIFFSKHNDNEKINKRVPSIQLIMPLKLEENSILIL